MTALLTDNLPLLASAPNGIKKLRELIFELAVRGKLLPQDPKDEPARELLKRIIEEKTRLVAEGKLKKQKPMTNVSDEETPFELPQGWEWSRLDQISSDIQYGFTASANHQCSEPLLLRITDIQNDKVNWASVPGCDVPPNEAAGYELTDGDIVIARTGGTIGKSYLVSGLTQQAVFASYLIRIGRLDSSYSKFTKVFLGSQLYWKQLYANSMGTGQPNVNGTALKGLLISLPPLAEQHRIVAKVDELMALCDRLEAQQADAEIAHARLVQALLDSLTQASDCSDFAASWQHLAEHFHSLFTTESSIDALKQSLRQLAVMGKLTNSEILTHLQIQDVAQLVDGDRGKNYPKAHDYLPDGYCLYLSTKNVRSGHFEFFEKQFLSEEKHKLLRNGKLERGDVVITTRGTLGNIAWYSDSIPYDTVRINSGMLIIRCSPEIITPDFLVKYIQSPVFDRQLQEMRTGSAQPQIPAGILKKFSLPIFSISDQHRIAAKVDQLMTLCDQLNKRIIQARRLNEQLTSTLIEDAVA